ncbi:MAG: C39 family peptidase [Chloroflexota bacterium]
MAVLAACPLLAAFVYNLPPVRERLGWRVSNLRAEIWYALNRPEEALFTPNATVAAIVQSTLQAIAPTLTPTASPDPTGTLAPTSTPTPEPTPLPEAVQLNGVRHEFQYWNNCAPATLSMALSYWGWEGDQRDTARVLKPNPRDKNVMPYEMEAFVEEHTSLLAVVRAGGDLDLLRRFIAAGFPVIIEKGFDVPGKEWMGHYELLTGYDDQAQRFTAQDSYIGPDYQPTYDQIHTYWRHFNYTYLIIYPPDREAEVMALLGPQVDETANYQYAAQLASDEIYALSGRDQFFTWFNRGTNLVRLQDYAGAAAAYDNAYLLQPEIPSGQRPWRILWYQTGPYFAYYYTGRYSDVINLASLTLDIPEPVLEESYYWRGLAREALGDVSGAIDDLRTCLQVHVGFAPCEAALERMGVVP